MEFKLWIAFVAALIPLVIGMIWYNPKVFGNAWMKASNTPMPEPGKGPSMIKMLGLTYLMSVFVAMALISITIHQTALFSLMAGDKTVADPNSEAGQYLAGLFAKFGGQFRTFGHGAFHGTLAGLFIAIPVTGVSALYEGRSFKYVMIAGGFWVVSMALMGGVICGFM
jgi:hypothetical protein